MSPLPDGFSLRDYSPADLDRVVRFAAECYAQSDCLTIHPGDVTHFMSNTWRGADFSQNLLLAEDLVGTLVGLVMLFPPRSAGYWMILHASQRGAALEPALIAEAEARMIAAMREAGKTDIGSDVDECDEVRRKLLEAAGYKPTGAPYMMHNTRSLNEPIPDSILPEGFSIRSITGDHEAEALGIVHSGAFNSNWTAEAYRAVMNTPGFHIDREIVVVAPDGRLAAFLIYWVDEVSGSGLFEPVGCHRDFQGRGLTKALLYEGMRRMKALGLHTAVVNNNTDNAPAVATYRSVGFTPQHGIYDYRKAVDQAESGSPSA